MASSGKVQRLPYKKSHFCLTAVAIQHFFDGTSDEVRLIDNSEHPRSHLFHSRKSLVVVTMVTQTTSDNKLETAKGLTTRRDCVCLLVDEVKFVCRKILTNDRFSPNTKPNSSSPSVKDFGVYRNGILVKAFP